MDITLGKSLSFKPKPFFATYSFSIACACDFSSRVLPAPCLAVSTFTLPLCRSYHLNVERCNSHGRIPVSLKMLSIMQYFLPALEIRMVVSSSVGT